MGRSFLAILAITEEALSPNRIEAARKAATSLGVVLETERLMLWSDHKHSTAPTAAHAVVGETFDRGDVGHESTFDETVWKAIIQSRGQDLVERYWGSYVAFTSDDAITTVVRAPLGDLGCYYIRSQGMVLVASHLRLLLDAADHVALNTQALARHIAYPEWRRDDTCLDGVMELRGGDRLILSAEGVQLETLWSPWAFTDCRRAIDDPAEAAHAVRDAVNLTVRARSANCRHPLLLLSGGLDSAIVAASLIRANADFICLNLVGDDAASDERHYAETVAHALGVRLLTRKFEVGRVDVRQSGAAHMPYPVHRCFTQAQDAVAAEIAAQYGADVIMDGGGGDNVFFASRTVAILADCLAVSGPDARFRDMVRVLADLGQTSTWTLACRAAYRAWFRSPVPRQPRGDVFLSVAARAIVDEGGAHPWLRPPGAVLPGRACHIALLAPAQNLAEAINAQALRYAISPLISQPIVEACLRVPSWYWLAPGRDRATARRAFEPVLPKAIAGRRSKGTPTGFVATIFDRHRHIIREMLLGGRLSALGLLDEVTLSNALSQPGPVRDLRFVRIMELLDAEAWARAHS